MFMIKLPQYSSQEVMTQQLMYAINCREDPLSGQTPPPLKTLDPNTDINYQWFYTPPLKTLDPNIDINYQWFYISTTQNPGSYQIWIIIININCQWLDNSTTQIPGSFYIMDVGGSISITLKPWILLYLVIILPWVIFHTFIPQNPSWILSTQTNIRSTHHYPLHMKDSQYSYYIYQLFTVCVML